jgi:hypothetical protein
LKYLRYILLPLLGIPVLCILLWVVAIPDDLIRDHIEHAVARSGNSHMSLSVKGFEKGIFFALYAQSLHLTIDGKSALTVTDFTGSFSPGYLTEGSLGIKINGKIGTGNISGILKLPLDGKVTIDSAELSAVPYLLDLPVDINGTVSAESNIRDNAIDIIFDVPDLHIDDSASVIPLLNTFKRLQGALVVKGNLISLDSVSLEGDKGFARLKGDIRGNVMNLALELMPIAKKLSTMESMLIGKYVVSPGYYVVPLKGPMP